ncbi:flippase [Haloplanus sp. GCM10025708]|uniref:flippase n=1 Tax=Haloplanus sp. GCM10025708 TaxID=3252679 RepID=UPI00361F1762
MADDSGSLFRVVAKEGTFVFVGRMFELGISFVGAAVLANIFESGEYGALMLGFSIVGMVSQFVVLGLDSAIGRYLPRYEDAGRRRSVLITAYRVAVPIAVLVGMATAFGADWLATAVFQSPEIAPILRIFGLAIPFAAVVHLSIGAMQGTKQALHKSIVESVTLPGTRVTLALVAVAFGGGVVGATYGYALSFVIAGAVGTYYVVKNTSLIADADVKPMYTELLRFSIPLVLTAIMARILADVDTIILGIERTPSDVGIYRVAYPIAQLLQIGLSSATFILIPVFSELDSDEQGERMRRVYQVVTKWIVIGTLPLFIVVFLFPERVISLTFGAKYVAGATALSVLAVGFFLDGFIGPNSVVLTAIGRTREVAYDHVAGALLNVVLNLWLIPQYGVLGAAVATTISYTVMNGLYTVQMYRNWNSANNWCPDAAVRRRRRSDGYHLHSRHRIPSDERSRPRYDDGCLSDTLLRHRRSIRGHRTGGSPTGTGL